MSAWTGSPWRWGSGRPWAPVRGPPRGLPQHTAARPAAAHVPGRAEYVGCFKVRDNSENRLRLRTHRWYDPHHELLEGDASYYAEGPFYVLPGPVIDGIARSGLTVRMGGPNEGARPAPSGPQPLLVQLPPLAG